jgi:peroxiredoxin
VNKEERMTRIEVARKAPRFALSDQHGETMSLDDARGKRIVLSFHPLAWTPVCSRQMQALERNRSVFERNGAVAFGVSVDPVPSKLAWAKKLGITETRLLSDFWPHGGVAQQFGIFREKDGFSERAVIVLDKKRVVRFGKVYPLAELPDLDEVFGALETMED